MWEGVIKYRSVKKRERERSQKSWSSYTSTIIASLSVIKTFYCLEIQVHVLLLPIISKREQAISENPQINLQ